ncbi:PLP-dependent aminotransferase family protein [Ruminiclostridium josui]|uniref:MocR-like pyridoxine biosynthesis transcription factor PdxR n=1 Tax=Ruminiclostridium josui TaxID=1499 RepID=UPI000A58E20D|nr:PLP-dependent aminotransferase family protein [Ruminiclostridium josui]
MKNVSIQFANDQQPKYLQLFNSIKEKISQGEMKPGERLPAIRSLASQLGVNTSTVVNAYKQLESNSYITAKKGSGYFVSNTKSGKQDTHFSSDLGLFKDTSVINFASATPHPSIFPIESFKACINDVLERDKGFAFGYDESNGYRPLRQSILKYFNREYSISVEDESFLQIVSGAQQGIDIIGKVLLNPGDYVVTETPTYDGAVAAFKSRGARVVSVNMDKDGMDMEELEKKVRICKPKLIYIMSRYQNPTTVCYSQEKLKELLLLAKENNLYIVEDDSMSELCFEKEKSTPLKTLDTGNEYVIYLKSFSKILMPGLRVGCMVMPYQLLSDFTNIKHTSDISSSGLIQRSLDLYFRSEKWDEHLQYMKEIYRGRFEFMLNSLENISKYGFKFQKPGGGLYFWVKLPRYLSAKLFYQKCKSNGLVFIPSYIL